MDRPSGASEANCSPVSFCAARGPSAHASRVRMTGRGFASCPGDTNAHIARTPITMPARIAPVAISAVRRFERGWPCDESVTLPSASNSRALASSSRTSPASRNRCVGSLRNMRCKTRRMELGVCCGSASQSGSARTTAASVSVTVSPRNAARPVSIS